MHNWIVNSCSVVLGLAAGFCLTCGPSTNAVSPPATPEPIPGTDSVLAVVYPNGGEVLEVGRTYTLRLSQDAGKSDLIDEGYHDVELYLTDGDVIDPPIGLCEQGSFDIVSSKGRFQWTVPDTITVRMGRDPATGAFAYSAIPIPRSSSYRLIVSSYEALCANDESDGTFTIK
jgi:hypothetical protein